MKKFSILMDFKFDPFLFPNMGEFLPTEPRATTLPNVNLDIFI